jgi:hypothetical protein
MWLTIYHPPYRNVTQSVPPEVRSKVLLVSLEVLERSRPLETKKEIQKWAWLFRSFVQWHAIAYLLAGLCQQQQGQYPLRPEFIDRAWKQLDHVFGERYRDDGRNIKEGRLWLALTRLLNRAKAVRGRAALHLTSHRPELSQQTNYQKQTKNYGNSLTVSNGPLHPNMDVMPESPLQYDSETYQTIGATSADRSVAVMAGDYSPNQDQPHHPEIHLNNSTFTTQQLAIDPHDPLVHPSSYTNFPMMAMDSGITGATRLFEPSEFSNDSVANLNWQEWDTVMRDFQFDIDGREIFHPD